MNKEYGLTEHEIRYIPLRPYSYTKVNYKKEVLTFALALITIIAACAFIKLV